MTQWTRPLVMVVDDEDPIRENLCVLLTEFAHCEVRSASHGADALAQLDAGLRPDLILLDLMMPVMGGEEFLVELARREYGRIPVCVVSGASVRPASTSSYEYVRKPFKVDELLEIVRQKISRPYSEQEAAA